MLYTYECFSPAHDSCVKSCLRMLLKTCTVRTETRKEPECVVCNLSLHAVMT